MKSKNLDNLRHSAAHLLAAAVLELWPKAKPTLGPPIAQGFYYDFDFSEHNTPPGKKDLKKIEDKMHEIVKGWDGFSRIDVSFEDVRKKYKENPYKMEMAKDLEKEKKKLSVYKSGDFEDLCGGGHTENPCEDLKFFKLTTIAGAYWRGSEKNKMLTRIYGTVFPCDKELKDYLHKIEESKKRNHKKIGKELGFYLFSDQVGPGLPIYPPKAGVVISEIENFMKQMQEETGYGHVYTPHIGKEELYQTSGHLQWFAEGMYPPMKFEGEGKYYVKPMNCPFHIQIYKMDKKSYKDLPVRYAEFGTVYRYERSGEISGLLRTRGFTQDDAHIFCREDQVIDEFIRVFEFTDKLLNGLGLCNYWLRLSLRGDEKEKYAGNIKQWDKATELIKKALKKAKINYKEAPGEAAFYGPKLDVLFSDSIGRDVQISTIQIDFLLPDRFNLTYTSKNGEKKQPYMIHRAPLGSRERILAILLEHYLGSFPVWLSPVQVVILPITKNNTKYALSVFKKLSDNKIRVKINLKNETLGAKIRDAQLEKIPYMLVIGEKEEKEDKVCLRLRTGEDCGQVLLDKFTERVKEKINKKALDL